MMDRWHAPAPKVDPFRAWKPPLCHKDKAQGIQRPLERKFLPFVVSLWHKRACVATPWSSPTNERTVSRGSRPMRGQYFEYLDQWERSTLTSARPLLVSDGSLRVKETSSPVPSVPASLCCWRNPSGSTLKAFSWLDWNKNFSSLFCRLRFQYFYLLSGIILMETNKIETRRNVVGFSLVR